MHKIAVLGAGTWGWALTKVLVEKGIETNLWTATGFNIKKLQQHRAHPRLANSFIKGDFLITENMDEALKGTQAAIMVVASPYVRQTARKYAEASEHPNLMISATKGLEAGTALTMTEIIEEEVPGITTSAISGGSHAEEVIHGLPFALTCASADPRAAMQVARLFQSQNIGIHITNDVVGVELAAALKNIIAIAAGISDGVAFGDNCRAALVTRGLHEIARVGDACGAQKHTFYEDCGIGDLLATAFSPHSRNRRFGLLIGRGLDKQSAMEEIGMAVEGLNAIQGAMLLAKRHNIEANFASLISEIVKGEKQPEDVASLVCSIKLLEQ